jgi:hypothetical protein
MLKQLILGACLLCTLSATCGESSLEVLVKVNNKTLDQVKKQKSKRVYPNFKTEMTLLAAYAEAWNREDYRLMYHLLAKDTRGDWTYAKFKRLLKADKEANGGLKKFLKPRRISSNGSETTWSVPMVFKFTTAGGRTARAVLVKQNGCWFVKSGGLLPPDLSPFDR